MLAQIPLKRPPFKEQNARVTLIVGIICREGIVLASDGQTTDGYSKRECSPKVLPIKFSNGSEALAGYSGSVGLGFNTVSLMQKTALASPLADKSTMLDLAKSAMNETRHQIPSPIPVENLTEEQWRHHLIDNDFSLMLAFHTQKQSCLYTMNLKIGQPEPQAVFATVGCASDIAQFFLRDLNLSEMSLAEAAVTAIYLVEMAKQVYSTIGFQTQVATICSIASSFEPPFRVPPIVTMENSDKINAIAKMLIESEKKKESDWKNKLSGIITKLSDVFTTTTGAFTPR